MKVCVYAICKNEGKNIDRWYNSVKNADLVVILDTGSEDNTIEKILQYPILYRQKTYEDFDFSVARNDALKIARENCDSSDKWIFMSLDLDEFLEDDGIKKLKENWNENFDVYRLKGITEGEGGQYVDHKIHSDADWFWKRSVHEIISLPGKKQKEWIVGQTEEIQYVHVQDLNKTRNYYDKLKKSYKKDPTDIKTVIYLAWESKNNGNYDDFLQYSLECIDLIKNNSDDDFYMDYEYLLQCYINCADYYVLMEQYAVADMYLNYGMKIIEQNLFPRIRRLYYKKAEILWELSQKQIAIDYYKKCLEIKERPYCWIDEDDLYEDSLIYSQISNAYFYFSHPKEALAYAQLALNLKPNDENLQRNINLIKESFINHVFTEKKNKICVYAICKNEEQFVEKWLNSMQEADYIVVLDTGSSDNTYELLKNDHRVYRVEQKVISPWRFDTARNESLKLVPDDANILLSTDLDEWLEPGWADVIRNSWIDGYHVRGTYKYAWSHTENGEPGRIFYYDKLHDKNWYWTAPVHELLHSDIYTDEYRFEHSLDLFDCGVYLHHYPDTSKSRGSYLPLLELRAKENPEDYYGKYYLSHEYNYRYMYKESIAVLEDILKNYQDKYSNLEIAACYLFLGDNYRSLNDLQKAIYYYNLSIQQDSSYREPYLYAAEIFNELNMYNIAISYVQEALNKTYRHYTWVERDDSWREKTDDILSISYFYLGDYENSLRHAERAFKGNPFDGRIKWNLDLIKQTINTCEN